MARILLITNIFPPDIGGPATYIDAVGHALSDLGHKVTVVCTSEHPAEPTDAHRPFRVRRIFRRNRIFIELMARVVLAQEILRHKLILVNGLETQAAQIARLLHRHYILKIVGDDVWELARNTGLTTLSIDEFQKIEPKDIHLQRRAKRREGVLRQAQLIITPSQYLRQLVVGWGVSPSQIQVIFNGVALNEYEGFQARRRESDILQVAYCGRLTNWKGVETLLLAAKALPKLKVSIIGDGPEWPMLAGLTHQLELTHRVEFMGRLTQSQLRTTLSKMDALVLDSGYEGLSHTLLEAGALGVACIASDRGGNSEVIKSGENGLLVPYGDVAQLTAALERLQNDETLRYRLACNAKINSLSFDFATTVQHTIQTLLAGNE